MTKFGSVLIQLASIDSTNNYVAKMIAEGSCLDGSVIMADYQTQGRGQRGNSWQSVSKENLLFSLAFRPNYSLKENIRLSWYSSLVWQQCLLRFGVRADIKWPNDLYVEGKKIGGLLIEQQLIGEKLEWAILGCGVNVNQKPDLPMATSIQDEVGRRYQPLTVLTEFLDLMNAQQQNLLGDFKQLKEKFESELWLKDETLLFTTKKDDVFEGQIIGVNDMGEILIETAKDVRSFGNKEVTFLPGSHYPA